MEWSPGTANPITETPATAWRRDPSDSWPYPEPQDPPVLRQYSASCEPHPSAAFLSLVIAACGGSCDRSQARECIYGLAPFPPPAASARTESAKFHKRLSAVAPGTPRQESQVPLVEQIDLAKKWLSVTDTTLVRTETIGHPINAWTSTGRPSIHWQVLRHGVKLFVQWSEAALDGRQNPNDLAQSGLLLSESDRMGLQAEI